jgi:hypothetical protein
VAPSTEDGWDFHSSTAFAPAFAPYKEVKLTVQDHTGGSHTTYSAYKTQG